MSESILYISDEQNQVTCKHYMTYHGNEAWNMFVVWAVSQRISFQIEFICNICFCLDSKLDNGQVGISQNCEKLFKSKQIPGI